MVYANINGYLTKIQGWVGCAKNGMNVDFVKTGHKHNDNRWFFSCSSQELILEVSAIYVESHFCKSSLIRKCNIMTKLNFNFISQLLHFIGQTCTFALNSQTMTTKSEPPSWQNGLSLRQIAQIIRRKMTTRVKPSAKVYDRAKVKTQRHKP